MHTLQGVAVSPHRHDSGSPTTAPFAWHNAPVKPAAHANLCAQRRTENTEGGQERLVEAVRELSESRTFADQLWSFHRAAYGAGDAVAEDHLTTLCARMYLAGQMSEPIEPEQQRPLYGRPVPWILNEETRGIAPNYREKDAPAVLRALLLTHDYETVEDYMYVPFAEMAVTLGQCDPAFQLFYATLAALQECALDERATVLAQLAARMFLAGSVWGRFTLSDAEVSR